METEEQRKEVQNQLVDRECKLSSKWLCLRHYLFSAYFVLEDHQSMFYLLFTSLVSFKNIVLLFLTFVYMVNGIYCMSTSGRGRCLG